MSDLYQSQLLNHFRKPYNRGQLESASRIARGSNPRCGDELEVGVFFEGETLEMVRFEARGCSICIASASMMAESAEGLHHEQAQQLCAEVEQWFSEDDEYQNELPSNLPKTLSPLVTVRSHAARKPCVLLGWRALQRALADEPIEVKKAPKSIRGQNAANKN